MLQIEFDAQEIQGALPDYRYVSRLGSGAFASVHLVANRKTNEQTALKKISCFGLGQYQKSGAANQVRILGSLDHKNIIKVFSSLFDNNEDILYIFMEYANSGDLTHLIDQAKQKKKRIPQTTIWKAISDISDGLQYLHRSQIIHRDLKPANIFRADKSFKIGDMNVSKIVKGGNLATTKTGSPLYTAPEVWEQEPYNEKCDVWSLGVLVYELCALRVPFQASSIDELIKKIKSTSRSKAIPSIYSVELNDLVHRMLQMNPKKRISAVQIFKIAQQKMKIEIQGIDEPLVQNLMETIVFPQTHQRWINLIPLPPKTCRKQSNGSSIKKQKSRQKSRDRSRDYRKKTQTVLQQQNSNIFVTQRPPISLPRSKSRSNNQQNTVITRNNSINRLPRVRLPSIHKRNSSNYDQAQKRSVEHRQKSKSRDNSRGRQATQKTRDSSSSARVNRKMVEKYITSAKRLINVHDQ